MISFMDLGQKLDDLIADIQEFNWKMPWYKLYSYYSIKRKIKRGYFRDGQHFERFMSLLENQPYAWRCKKLRQIYKGESR